VRRHVGEPFDVAAKPIAGVLHHQRVDVACRHLLAHRAPAALELGGGDWADQPLGKVSHGISGITLERRTRPTGVVQVREQAKALW